MCDNRPGEQVITDALSNRSKGYGFVRFGDEKDRDRSLGEMQGHYIANRPIRVSLATAKRASTTSSQPSTASRDGAPSESMLFDLYQRAMCCFTQLQDLLLAAI